MKRRNNGNKLTDVLTAAEEGLNALRGGKALATRTLEVPEPTRFSGQRVARVRKRLGLDQVDFAQLIGTSPSTVRAWERGEKTPGGIAARLLEIAEREPEVLTRALESAR